MYNIGGMRSHDPISTVRGNITRPSLQYWIVISCRLIVAKYIFEKKFKWSTLHTYLLMLENRKILKSSWP
jgi:hypothetical protein